MYHRESREFNLMLALLMLSLVITQVRGQASPEITVGTATIRPTIDGQWQQAEWANAIEYTLSESTGPAKLSGYFRMIHDANNLYGIIDVPFDNGTEYLNANVGYPVGTVFLAFYYGTSYVPSNQTQLHADFQLAVNQTTKRPTMAVICSPLWQWCRQDPNIVISRSQVATSLSATTHSNSKHRIWEFSIPIHPYVITAPLDTNPTIGMDVVVVDTSSYQIHRGTLAFVSTPVPEILSGQMMLPLIVIMPLLAVRLSQKTRRISVIATNRKRPQ